MSRLTLPPGTVRGVVEPYQTPRPMTEHQRAKAEIEAGELPALKARYRELIFIKHERELTPDETVELVGVTDRLGLDGMWEKHERAIRDVELELKARDETFDIPALKESAAKKFADGADAICLTVTDSLRATGSLQMMYELLSVVQNRINSYHHMRGCLSDIPSRGIPGLIDEYETAKAEVIRAESQGTKAAEAIYTLMRKPENRILWPE